MSSIPVNAFVSQAAMRLGEEEQKGGDSNNIPPSISQQVTGSEDTAVIGCGVSWGDGYSNLMDRLELRKAEAQVSQSPVGVAIGDSKAIISPSGFSAGAYVAYKLTLSGIRMGISRTPSPYGETPNVYFSMGSEVLMYNDGIAPVWWYCQELIKSLGGELLWNKVSRVDMCVDLWDVPVRALHDEYREGCVTKARYKATYEWGLSLSGFVLGKGDIQLRVYDKRLECEKDPSKWAILMARRRPEDWDGRFCTRVEFQARREFLKSCGINTVDDWIAFRAGVCEYLCTEWARICEPITDRTHTSRAGLSTLWEKVREQFAFWTGGGVAATRTFRDVEFNGEALFRMALGCLGRIVASKAEGEIYDFEGFLTRLRQTFVDGLVDRDLEALQERFIMSFAAADPYLGLHEEVGWEYTLDESGVLV